MAEKFNKDEWVRQAFRLRHINCDRLGNIYRNGGNSPKGGILWVKVKLQTHKKSGRVYWNLTFKGITKSVLVNRAICLRYLPNPENLAESNHKDGDKQNNRLDNLEWANRSEQEKHAFATGLKSTRGSQNSNAKLTAAEVTEIRLLAKQPALTPANLAAQFKVSVSTIRGIIERKTWTHL